jgi:hypothetical protein
VLRLDTIGTDTPVLLAKLVRRGSQNVLVLAQDYHCQAPGSSRWRSNRQPAAASIFVNLQLPRVNSILRFQTLCTKMSYVRRIIENQSL